MLTLALATAALAALPEPLSGPIRRVAEYDAAGPDPLWDADVDGAAIRRAGRLLPDDTTYYVHASRADPVLFGNLKAAGQLFLFPALPVRGVEQARWVLSYRAARLLPTGVRARRVFRLGDRIFLVRVAP